MKKSKPTRARKTAQPAGPKEGGWVLPREDKPRGTVAEVFSGLAASFQRHKSIDVEAVVLFDIAGPGGGLWSLTVREENCSVAQGRTEDPHVLVTISERDFLDISAGNLSFRDAYETGRLSIRGDLGVYLKMETLFEA